MAYTYENFTTAAQNAGLLDGFSEDDLSIAKTNPEYGLSLLALRQDAAGATTTEQKLLAQEAENQLRSTYGSLAAPTQSSFTYGKQNEYQKLLDEVTNYQPFSYDIAADPSYSAYKKAYLREAERATQDTLAKASAASGGVPSSYAVSAAQQAGNYYTGQLNDAIPTLQQNAYQRYLSDYNAKLSAFDAMNTDRNFDYNAYLQEFERKQQEWNNALTLYQMGQRTPEILEILGLPEENAGGGSGSGSSSGSGGSRASNNGGITIDDVITEYMELKSMGAKTSATDNYLRQMINQGVLTQRQATDLREARPTSGSSNTSGVVPTTVKTGSGALPNR